MAVVETVAATEPQAVAVEGRPDGTCDVWLRKNIRQEETAGEGGEASQRWVADELHFVSDGPVTAGEAQAGFDALWSAHERDGVPVERRVAEVEAASELRTRALGLTLMSAGLSDADALSVAPLYPEWEEGRDYSQGQVLRHGDGLYRVG